jgi:hypothetical protein
MRCHDSVASAAFRTAVTARADLELKWLDISCSKLQSQQRSRHSLLPAVVRAQVLLLGLLPQALVL